MTTLTNSAEGGTNGTNATAANSGGGSGSAFDAVTTTATCSVQYSSTQKAHGSLSYAITYGATAGNAHVDWSTSMGTNSQIWFRMYLYFTGNPASNTMIWGCNPATGSCARLFVMTGGLLRFNNSAGAQVLITTNTIPLNAWFRVEGFVIGSPTAGQLEVKLFDTMDSSTPTETQTSGSTVNTNSASITTYQFGDPGTAVANIGPYYMDDLGLSNTAYVGPVGASTTPSDTDISGTTAEAMTVGVDDAIGYP